MTGELGFLVDLLLSDRLPKMVRVRVSERIKELERLYSTIPDRSSGNVLRRMDIQSSEISRQAPSTQAILARNPDLADAASKVSVIAQTPEAVAAMKSREDAIANSIAGKVNKATGRAPKF